MRGLRALGWRGFLRRRARYALTALGIVLGVADLFGVIVTNESTNRSLAENTFNFAGGADAIAWPVADRFFSGREIKKLRDVPDARAVAALWEGALLDGPKHEVQRATLGAIDDAGRDALVAPQLERGRMFRSGEAEVVLSRNAARLLDVEIGGRVRVGGDPPLQIEEPGPKRHARRLAPDGFRVTGILRNPPGLPDDGGLYGSFTSLSYLWERLDIEEATQVRFFLEEDIDPATWAADRVAEFPDARFEAAGMNVEFRRFLDVLQGAMSGAAMIAVFVGAFLIYLTFSMTVVERTRMYGTLHAVGATGSQVGRAVLTEALILGSVATAVGIGAGVLMSAGLLQLVAGAANIRAPSLYITPGAVVLGVAVGLVATLAGSFVPARRAGRLSPVEAIRGTQSATPAGSRVWIAGAAFLALGLAMSITERGIQASAIFSQTATLFVLLGSVLLVPPLVGPMARAARSTIRRAVPGAGEVAVMHLVRERSRSAYTLGLVMVVLAMMLALAATNGSLARSVEDWVDKRFGADLFAYNQGIRPKTQEQVAKVTGVESVASMTFGRVRMTQPTLKSMNLILIDPDSFFDVAGFPWAEGSDEDARKALSDGRSVLVPSSRANEQPVSVGQEVVFETAHGPRTYSVGGVYASFGVGPEVGVVAAFSQARALGAARSRNVLYIDVDDPGRVETVKRRVDDRLAELAGRRGGRFTDAWRRDGEVGRSGYFFITGATIKDQARREVSTYFSLFYAVLLVAVFVGLLGLANTMVMSVLQRYREIGIIQAVGAAPRDIRRMVIAESALLVGVAFVLSLVLGTLLSRLIVDGAGTILGFGVEYVFPFAWIPILGVLAIVVGLASAFAPARRAARLTPVEALRYE